MADDDPFSLDFTNYTPPPAPPPAPAVAPKPAVEVPSYPHLTFPAALQEAAAFYAAGKDLEATQRLESALRSKEPLGDRVRQVWHALFELLQALGLQQGFETLALGYAQRFGVSPPSWQEPSGGGNEVTTSAGGRAQVSLAGPLGARVADALKQVIMLAQKCQGVRIDLARLTDADSDGATLLLRALAALKKLKKEVVLGAPEHLAALLAPRLVPDQRENESMWLLLLELYQQAGRQEEFEEAAVNYAVTFDVSPPSYEAPPANRPAPEPEPEPAAEAAASPLCLSGQLLGKRPEDFAALAEAAQDTDPVEIRADSLQRIDAASIEALKPVLAGINATGRRVRIAGLAQLPAVFLAANGCDQLAELETRKI